MTSPSNASVEKARELIGFAINCGRLEEPQPDTVFENAIAAALDEAREEGQREQRFEVAARENILNMRQYAMIAEDLPEDGHALASMVMDRFVEWPKLRAECAKWKAAFKSLESAVCTKDEFPSKSVERRLSIQREESDEQ